jgi:hypothetical protein
MHTVASHLAIDAARQLGVACRSSPIVYAVQLDENGKLKMQPV